MYTHEDSVVEAPAGNESMESMEASCLRENVVTRFFQEARHIEEIVGLEEETEESTVWRKYGKERMRTMSVAMILCLHLGVEPPGKPPRPQPCAKLEAWVDPTTGPLNKAAPKIAASLQKAYERWQPRALCKSASDPTVEEVKRICVGLRKNAKEERVLFHYNGHGVPQPTVNGEIWVFNRNFTQYMPLSLYDLQQWMGVPSIYVWDCDNAEIIVNHFNRFAADHEIGWMKELDEYQEQHHDRLPPLSSTMGIDEQAAAVNFTKKRPRFKECIQLAACKVEESLPQFPELPADLFTACLTTPIHMSILWYLIRTNKTHFFPNLIEDIPGVLTDRKTLLGELNWIFTAITDTIAWNALPRDLFQRLFRQDMLLSSLFRSFLLAERIMGAYGCTVLSCPRLPSTADHALWESWEYTIDLSISHLIAQKFGDQSMICPLGSDYFIKSNLLPLNTLIDFSSVMKTEGIQDSQYNSFFIEQLRAFEVWLEYGVEKRLPPQQLPVVLQVLLSQVYRVRALELLARFLDHGQWAVGYALSVGIFPYVLKLLQSNTRELKPSLAFIWAKILAVDPGCQAELFKENGEESRMASMSGRTKEKKELRYFYFVKMLNDPSTPPRQKVVPAFVLATLFHNNFRTAQQMLTEQGYVNLCTELLADPIASGSRLFKLWILIGLGRLWADYNNARWQAVRLVAYDKVQVELEDESPEVRAAAVYALGCLVKNRAEKSEHALHMSQQLCDSLCSKCTRDGAHIVREELLVALQYFVCDSSSMLANLHRRLREQTRSMPSRVEEEEMDSIHVETGITEESVSVETPAKNGWMRVSSYRRKKKTSESSVAIDELGKSPTMSDDLRKLAVRQQYSFDSDDVACREESIKMLRILESKSFVDPTERIFIAVLRLALDPIERVSRMARVLVRYIADLSERKVQMHREIISNASYADLSTRFDSSFTPQRQRNNAGNGTRAASGIFDVTGIGEEMGRSRSISQDSAPGSSQENGNMVSPPFHPPHLPALQKAKDDSDLPGPSGGAMFTVGSPQDRSQILSTTPIENVGAFRSGDSMAATPLGPIRKLSAPPLTSTPKPSAESQVPTPRIPEDFPFLKPDTFESRLPKRIISQKREFGNRTKRIHEEETEVKPWEDLVETKFVPWCSRVFTEPILDLVQSEEADCAYEGVLTQANATDWAIHYEEGLNQMGSDEFARINAKPELMGEQRWSHKRQGIPSGTRAKGIVSCVFSVLRPYVYFTDGDTIEMLQYETVQLGMGLPSSSTTTTSGNRMTLVNSFPVHAGNAFSVDTVSWLEVINPMSTEMLMSASADGIVKVWDVHLNVHSHKMVKETTLITAAFPLADATRTIEKGVKGTTTVYEWSQSSGVLLCSGNVKVCRLWDAHTERSKLDIPTGRKTAVVAMSAELEHSHLIALGFRDGAVHVHDTRMPSSESRILEFAHHSSDMVGVSVRTDGTSRCLLSAASSDGVLCVWEPRMFTEPLVDVNTFDDPQMQLQQLQKKSYESISGGASMLSCRMHDSAQMLACSFSTSAVRVYDISGRLVAPLKPWGAAPLLRPAVTAFHPRRALLAVSHASTSGEACLSIFGPPEKITRGGRERIDRR